MFAGDEIVWLSSRRTMYFVICMSTTHWVVYIRERNYCSSPSTASIRLDKVNSFKPKFRSSEALFLLRVCLKRVCLGDQHLFDQLFHTELILPGAGSTFSLQALQFFQFLSLVRCRTWRYLRSLQVRTSDWMAPHNKHGSSGIVAKLAIHIGGKRRKVKRTCSKMFWKF